MKNRDLSVAFCGMVAGVILGAGAISPGSSVVTASAVAGQRVAATFNAAPNAADYTRRKIEARGIRLYGDSDVPNAYPTVKSSSSSSAAPASAGTAATPCSASRAVIATIRAAYDAAVPDTIRNTEIRRRMNAAFADAADDFCAPAAATHPASSVDNDCGKYAKGTMRYSQCTINESLGKAYPE